MSVKNHDQQQRQRGFTLIELMVTLAIAAIVLTQAVPSFRAMIANNRVTTQVNDIVTSIQYGRNEAAKRSSRVVVCYSGDPTATAPVCGGTPGTNPAGWLVFATADGTTNFASSNSNFTLLRVDTLKSSTVEVKLSSTLSNGLELNSDGSTNEGGTTAVFAVCDERGEDYGKQIQIQPSGHVQLVKSPITNCDPQSS